MHQLAVSELHGIIDNDGNLLFHFWKASLPSCNKNTHFLHSFSAYVSIFAFKVIDIFGLFLLLAC